MSIDNYPPGAANDPSAPYNQKELPEFIPVECKDCGSSGPLNDECECEDCFIERVSEEPPGRDYDQEAKDQRLEDETNS
jgi:hypothetical protein